MATFPLRIASAPLAFAAFFLAAPGCSSPSDTGSPLGASGSVGNGGGNSTSGGSGVTGGVTNTEGGSTSTGGGITFAGTFGTAGASGSTGNGTPETCDGVDNDGNGIIDDLDVGNDGVCDCLNIATLGQIGPWSNGGNVFASWLNARSPMGAVALDDQVLTPDLLKPFQVIVSLHVGTMTVRGNGSNAGTAAAHHAFSADEAAAFKAWVENGGGAMSTIGYFSDEAKEVVNVNLLLNPLGVGYSTTKLDLSGFVTTWNAHPLTMGITSINTQNGVEPADMATTLAIGQSDRLALQAKEAGKGHVVVWGDEWITYDSEWADQEHQQVELFWVNILKWLSPPNRCQVPIPPTIIR